MEFEGALAMTNLALLTNVSLIYEVSAVLGRDALSRRFDLTFIKKLL